MKKRKTTVLMLLTLLLAMVLGMSASAKTGKNKVVKVKGKNGTYTYSGSYGDEKYIYHKFSVGQTGVLRITGYEQTKKGKKSGFTVMLFDKNKKRLDVNKENYINYTKGTIKYYVLSKGSYYFRIKSPANKKGVRYIIQMKYTKMGAYVKQTGASRDEAQYLAKDYSVYAYITASDDVTSSRWIQFYTDGKDPIELTLIPQLPKSTEGTFSACIYGPSYEDGKVLEISQGGDRYKLSTVVTSKSYGTTTKKTTGLKKGYYYVEIYRENSTEQNKKYANGYIKITRK